jgi:hypothetical protein
MHQGGKLSLLCCDEMRPNLTLSQFDSASVPWKEDPTPLIQTLQAAVTAIHAGHAAAQATRPTVEASTLEAKLAALSRPLKKATK